jgi:hypothetical protein
MSAWLLTNAAGALLLPPSNLLRRRWQRLGTAVTLPSLTLVAPSTNAGARLLMQPLENMAPALMSPRTAGAQPIVILGRPCCATPASL